MALKPRDLLRLLVGFLPEVRSPAGAAVPLRRKAAYTAASLAVFMAGSHLLLFRTGFRYSAASIAAHPQYWMRGGATASNSDTVMALGVVPLLVSECVGHLVVRLRRKLVRVNSNAPGARMLLNGAQKLLAILIAFWLAVKSVLGPCFMGRLKHDRCISDRASFSFGGVIIIYLDEVLKKGYGLVPGVPLFTVAPLFTAFSPYITNFYGGGRGNLHDGAVVSSIVHRLFASGEDESSAMQKAFMYRNLPDVASIITSCAFFLIVLCLQGFHIALPVRPHNEPGLQVNYTIRLSYISFATLLFQEMLVSSLYSIPWSLYMKFGENNKVVNLLGRWKESKYFGQAVPVSGIAYYATTPPTLADIGRDPVCTFLYAVLLLLGCASFSMVFFSLCSYSDRYVARLLGGRRSVMAAQPDSVPQKRWRRYVVKVAFLVGLFVGALTLLAGFIGVIGSGTGIMLAVTAIYSFYEGSRMAGKAGAFGL